VFVFEPCCPAHIALHTVLFVLVILSKWMNEWVPNCSIPGSSAGCRCVPQSCGRRPDDEDIARASGAKSCRTGENLRRDVSRRRRDHQQQRRQHQRRQYRCSPTDDNGVCAPLHDRRRPSRANLINLSLPFADNRSYIATTAATAAAAAYRRTSRTLD